MDFGSGCDDRARWGGRYPRNRGRLPRIAGADQPLQRHGHRRGNRWRRAHALRIHLPIAHPRRLARECREWKQSCFASTAETCQRDRASEHRFRAEARRVGRSSAMRRTPLAMVSLALALLVGLWFIYYIVEASYLAERRELVKRISATRAYLKDISEAKLDQIRVDAELQGYINRTLGGDPE